MSGGNVLALFGAPGRETSLKAIARALLRIRSTGWTCDQLAKVLGCSADTIENASNERSLLSFDSIALMGYHFPDEFELVEALWTCRATPAPTPSERLERIERELKALREVVE